MNTGTFLGAVSSGIYNTLSFQATNQRIVFQQNFSFTSGLVYTYSFMVNNRDNTTDIQSFIFMTGAGTDRTFEFLLNGVVVGSSEPVPLGLNKLSLRITTLTNFVAALRFGIGCTGARTGDCDTSIPQLEAGSNATSYIKTEATTVTRNADVISKTGISDLIGQTEGTLFVEFTKQSAEVSERYLAVGDGTTANRIMIIGGTNNTLRGFIQSNSILQFDFSAGNAIGTHKVAISYKTNDVVMYIDGIQVNIDTDALIPNLNNVYIGTHESGGLERLNGGINQALVFKTRLSNETLSQLTTL
jgi:hypothetical protein